LADGELIAFGISAGECMATPPTFFFSHARQDRETPSNYLRTFFEDLEIKLAQWAGVDLKKTRLGTFDSRVQQGQDWDATLSQGLAQNKAFVAILSPLYFTRVNCGKELFVFLLRHSKLGVDPNGALTGVGNMLPIRWLPENAYTLNTDKDALIPGFIRLISDTPDDNGNDPDRTAAIQRYQKKGMEKCVRVEPHYGELLDAIVERIRALPALAASSSAVSFATAKNAFEYDWTAHFSGLPKPPTAAGAVAPAPAVAAAVAAAPPAPVAAPAAAAQPPVQISPQPLTSIACFYVTRRTFARDAGAVPFADQLIAEMSGAPTDAALSSFLADARAAALEEGLNVFHAAALPAVPVTAPSMIGRLAALTSSKIMTALVIDSAVWPNGGAVVEIAAIDDIIKSSEWTGPVLIAALDNAPLDVDQVVQARALPPRLSLLPRSSSTDRIAALRRSFIDARGRVLQSTSGPAPESLPILRGVAPRT